MTAKGSPTWYRRHESYDHQAELERRRTTARANGMFDEFSERPAFEAYFAMSRCGRGPEYLAKAFERFPDGFYAASSTQRHWWTWQCALGAGQPLPPFDPIKIAAARLSTSD